MNYLEDIHETPPPAVSTGVNALALVAADFARQGAQNGGGDDSGSDSGGGGGGGGGGGSHDGEFLVVANVDPVGSGIVTGAGYYTPRAYCILHASPNYGLEFDHWTGPYSNNSTVDSITFPVDRQNLVFVAHFKRTHVIVSLEADPLEGGAVTGGGRFEVRSVIQLTAIPNEGFELGNWTSSLGRTIAPAGAPESESTVDVQLGDEDETFTAHFIDNRVTIRIVPVLENCAPADYVPTSQASAISLADFEAEDYYDDEHEHRGTTATLKIPRDHIYRAEAGNLPGYRFVRFETAISRSVVDTHGLITEPVSAYLARGEHLVAVYRSASGLIVHDDSNKLLTDEDGNILYED